MAGKRGGNGWRSPARQAIVEKVLIALRAGNTRRASARFAGIDENTMFRWLRERVSFRSQVEAAEADFEIGCVASIKKAALEKSWQAGAWLLERRRPADWRQRSTIEHVGEGGGPVKIAYDLDQLTKTQLEQLSGILAAAAPSLPSPEPDGGEGGDPT